MKGRIQVRNSFISEGEEALKRKVTEKVRRLISQQIRREEYGAEGVDSYSESRDILPDIHRGQG